MKVKKECTKQKLNGVYYTPYKLASFICNLYKDCKISKILEPSCGQGVFIEALCNNGVINNVKEVVGVEYDKTASTITKNKFKEFKKVKIKNQDFLEYYKKNENSKYDLIVGNPPYIRYQYLKEEQRINQSDILKKVGMKSNKLINAWVCFLVACVNLLNDNGKIAFVIPAEILQVAYAEELRMYLSKKLSKITLITFNSIIFPDIEQETLVLIGEKGNEEKGIRIIELNDLEDLDNFNYNEDVYQKMNHSKEKWLKYFISNKENELFDEIKKNKCFKKFSDFGIINVGITTGNNDYFSISDETSKKYELDNICLPLIGRSSHAESIFFTKKDLENNIISGKKAKLVCFPDSDYNEYPEKNKDYIKFGLDNQVNEGYKCSIRDKWYIVPSVWIPDAFFLRRNNVYPKFVLNQCDAVSTDTMHRIKFYDNVNKEKVLLSYYNSISFAFTEICGRSYGGGVLEILPGEVGNIMLPDLSGMDENVVHGLVNFVDEQIRKNTNIETILDVIDKEVLIKYLKMDVEVCKDFRNMWNKMKNRRLDRGKK